MTTEQSGEESTGETRSYEFTPAQERAVLHAIHAGKSKVEEHFGEDEGQALVKIKSRINAARMGADRVD
jgi:hypothetical protein